MDTGLDSLKTVSKKVVHKPGEFIGKKTADAVSQMTIKLWNKNLLKKQLFLQRKRWNIKRIKTSVIYRNGTL